MPVMNIHLDGDGIWKDLIDKAKQGKLIHHEGPIDVAALKGGMQSGKTSVSLRFDLPDGTTLIAETSLELFVSAARAFTARYGE